MAVDPQKKELLEELKAQIIQYVKAEKLRLTVERDFLQSVLNGQLSAPDRKARRQDDIVTIASVNRLLGVKETQK